MQRIISKKISLITLAFFVFASAFLVFSAVSASRDYQDSWILEGLIVPFAIFIVAFAAAFFSQKKLYMLVSLSVITRVIMLLVPNLKYIWFLGGAIDQQRQYLLANYVVTTGHVSSGDPVYSASPFINILLGVFSLIPGVSVNDADKFLPVILSALFPLVIFVIIKCLKMPHETTLLKIALFLAAIPVSIQSYLITGSQFGLLLSILAFCSLILLLERKDRRYLALFSLLVLALCLYHTTSSTFFAIFLCGLLVVAQGIRHFKLYDILKTNLILIAVIIVAAVLTLRATVGLNSIVVSVTSGFTGGVTPGSEFVASTFFDLFNADPVGGIMTILVNYGADLLLAAFAVCGIIILLKKRKELSKSTIIILILGSLLLLSVPLGGAIKAGTFRLLFYAYPFILILASVFLLSIHSKKKVVFAALLVPFFILTPIELYACQPLIPSANVLNSSLPQAEPIQYVNQVNSIYQRQMIEFTQSHFGVLHGRIAADSLTSYQALALTGYEYSDEHIAYNNPLDKSQPTRAYSIFLIHLPGKAGILGEQADYRSPVDIEDYVYNSTIIYSNGESFILTR